MCGLRDTHDSVLSSSKDASVWRVRVSLELDLCDDTDRVGHLHSVVWHAIRHCVVGQIHILVEKALQFGADEELFSLTVFKAISPDNLRLADR